MQVKWCSWGIVQKDDPENDIHKVINRVVDSSASEVSTMSASNTESVKNLKLAE